MLWNVLWGESQNQGWKNAIILNCIIYMKYLFLFIKLCLIHLNLLYIITEVGCGPYTQKMWLLKCDNLGWIKMSYLICWIFLTEHVITMHYVIMRWTHYDVFFPPDQPHPWWCVRTNRYTPLCPSPVPVDLDNRSSLPLPAKRHFWLIEPDVISTDAWPINGSKASFNSFTLTPLAWQMHHLEMRFL